MNIPQPLLNEFLDIINAYSVFSSKKEDLKSLIKWNHCVLSTSEFDVKKEILTSEMINSEKFYKLKKHIFNDKYPEHSDTMESLVAKYVEHHFVNVDYLRKCKESFHAISPKLIVFMKEQFAFSDTLSDNSVYQEFAKQVNQKYGIEPVGFENLILELQNRSYRRKTEFTLSASDIKGIVSIINKVLQHVKNEDFQVNSISVTPLSNAIIKKNLNKYIKLANHYNELLITTNY